MRTILLFLSTLAFCTNLFSQSLQCHRLIEDIYCKKFEQIDKSVYTPQTFVLVRHPLSTKLRCAYILVSRDVQGTEVSFYLDSMMNFYRNGQIKMIVANDTIGTPTFTRIYNRYGSLIIDWKLSYTGNIPYQPHKKASKEMLEYYMKTYHKNGILRSEGLTVGRKKEGLHSTYNKNGKVKSRKFYLRGKVLKTT